MEANETESNRSEPPNQKRTETNKKRTKPPNGNYYFSLFTIIWAVISTNPVPRDVL